MTKKATTKRKNPSREASSGAVPSPASEGQRLFVALADTPASIAAKIGCSRPLITYYRTGQRLPGHQHRLALEEHFRIPADAWDRAVGTTAPELVPEDLRGRTTLDAVDGQIVALYGLQRGGGLTPAARLKLADTLGKLLALKARLERDRELLEDRVVRDHPTWKRLREVLLAALRPFPEAARAAAAALQELGVLEEPRG